MNNRESIVSSLRAKIADKRPVIGGSAGTGLSAKCAEVAGLDFVVIYNSGRYRMAGRSSMAGLMPYGDANAIVMEMGAEILPVVSTLPVIAGVCGTDPFRMMPQFLAQVKQMGFRGVQNYPTVCLFDGLIRANLEETGLGFDREIEMIGEAHRLDLLAVAYVASEEEVKAMADAGADIVVPHMGLTTQGMSGARSSLTMDQVIENVQSLTEVALATNPAVIVVCHGGPIVGPEEVARVLTEVTGLHGFLGASSMERIPAEVALVAHMRRYTELRLGTK